MTTPLRYRITSWRQLSECKSNNSRELYITVTDFIQDNRLSGLRIQIQHPTFGVLFSYILDADGSIVSKLSDIDNKFELSSQQLLYMLGKFGFIVVYAPHKNLPSEQIEFLMTLKNLHYDKMRKLSVYKSVHGKRQYRTILVAFRIEDNPKWLDNTYAASEQEFSKAINSGSAFNISTLSECRKYNWNWLDFVANIDDIIKDNAGGIFE